MDKSSSYKQQYAYKVTATRVDYTRCVYAKQNLIGDHVCPTAKKAGKKRRASLDV